MIHPLIVHFPIGLLVTYALLEMSSFVFQKLRNYPSVTLCKTFLVCVGAASSYAAILTGLLAEEKVAATNPFAYIIETHELFAGITTLLFSALALMYAILFFKDRVGILRRSTKYIEIIERVSHSWLIPLLALIGLITITITGGLGASMVYGPGVDPFAKFIYGLFWAS